MLAAIDRYRAAGLDGVEAFYSAHDREQTILVADRCAELGLLATGSSDYHGPEHRLFSRFRAFELHEREPNLGPITAGTLAAPVRDGTGLCLWLTGLSGSGKSTIARLAAGRLRDQGHRVEVLDGDDVRQNLCAGLGFSREDRAENVRRIAFVADLLSRNGVLTFVAAVSPFRAGRADARAPHGLALRRGLRARLGRGVRAPRREGPVRARARRERSRTSPASPTPTRSPRQRTSCSTRRPRAPRLRRRGWWSTWSAWRRVRRTGRR